VLTPENTPERIKVKIRGGTISHSGDCPSPGLERVKLEHHARTGAIWVTCGACHGARFLPDQEAETTDSRVIGSPRYMLECCKCRRVIPRWTRRPVVPVCERCRDQVATRAERRRQRREAARERAEG
jgi:hypothetical protein